MHLTFNTTADDIRAFAGYIYTRSKTLRRSRLKNLALFAVTFTLLYFALFRHRGLHATLSWCVLSVLALIVLDFLAHRSYIKNCVKLYHEREGDRESRSSTLVITETGINAASEEISTEIKWAGIHRIDELDDRTYIFVSPITAIIISRDAVTDGDYRAFIDAVKKHVSDLSVRAITKG
ncbi:MAG: YcxB family protein [Candidatus Zixiibacteriota bacterium]